MLYVCIFYLPWLGFLAFLCFRKIPISLCLNIWAQATGVSDRKIIPKYIPGEYGLWKQIIKTVEANEESYASLSAFVMLINDQTFLYNVMVDKTRLTTPKLYFAIYNQSCIEMQIWHFHVQFNNHYFNTILSSIYSASFAKYSFIILSCYFRSLD